MDGTVADYDGAMSIAYSRLVAAGELNYTEACNRYGRMSLPDYIWNRCQLIKAKPGWWRNLPMLQVGDQIVHVLRQLGYEIHIASRGPADHPHAWSEKVDWVRARMPFVKAIHITEDKSLIWGDILVDDWPQYCSRWKERNPNGVVIMPAYDYNVGYPYFRYEIDMQAQLTEYLQIKP